MKKENWFDKILKEYFNFCLSYSISENGEKKILYNFGPVSFSYNITKWEESFWKFFEFKNSEKK